MKFETPTIIQKALKILADPIANYMPASITKWLLKTTGCETAELNWKDPGGWETMVVNYENRPKYLSDKIMVTVSTMGMALRNRRILASKLLTELIDNIPPDDPNITCLGSGPGVIIGDALKACNKPKAHATMVDMNSDSFAYGKELAAQNDILDRMNWIKADIRDTTKWFIEAPDILKMIGICEYLTDAQVRAIVDITAPYVPAGAKIITNSISKAHGNDRFFRRVLGINLKYRTPDEIIRLLDGFYEFQMARLTSCASRFNEASLVSLRA